MIQVEKNTKRFAALALCLCALTFCSPPDPEEASSDDPKDETERASSCTDKDKKDSATCSEDSSSLLHTEEVKACHAQDKMYDRNKKDCSAATIKVSYKCDFDGIVGAFSDAGISVADTLRSSIGTPGDPEDKGEGYIIDQCGAYSDSTPVVSLVKIDQDKAAPQLKVRVLQIN